MYINVNNMILLFLLINKDNDDAHIIVMEILGKEGFHGQTINKQLFYGQIC